MNLPCSTYYHQSKNSSGDDSELIAQIEAIIEEFPGYGYRRRRYMIHQSGNTPLPISSFNHTMILSTATQNTPGMNTFSHNAFLKNKKRRDGEVCLNSVQNTFLAGGQAKRCADLS